MPELEQIWQQADGGVQVIGFSLDRPAERSRIPGFVEKTGVTYPILTSEPEAWEELFRSGDIPVPLSVLVGADGKVEALFEGWSRETRRRLLALMGAAARVKPESSPIAPSPGS